MFYISELFFRVLYIFFSFLITFFIIFANKQSSAFLLLYYNNIDFDDSKFLSYSIDKTFVIRSPINLLDFDFKYAFLLTVILIIPILIWSLYYYFLTALTISKKEKFLLLELTINFYVLNHIFLTKGFSFFWNFIEYLTVNDLNIYFLNIDYDLNLYNFISNILELHLTFNIFLLFIFFLILYFFNTSLKFYLLKKRSILKITCFSLIILLLMDLHFFFVFLFVFTFLLFLNYYFSLFFYLLKNIKTINIK